MRQAFNKVTGFLTQLEPENQKKLLDFIQTTFDPQKKDENITNALRENYLLDLTDYTVLLDKNGTLAGVSTFDANILKNIPAFIAFVASLKHL